MTSPFDPKTFLDATLDAPTERREPLPVENPEAGDKLYIATIGDVDARAWESKNPDAKIKSGIAWDVELKVQIPTGLQSSKSLPPELTLYDSVMLDLTPSGTIDNSKGKNNRLRMYRDAVDLNKPGDVFSARKLVGRTVKLKVSHEMWQGSVQERVGAVLKM